MGSTPPTSPSHPPAPPPRPAGSTLLAWIVVLQVLTLIGQWTGPGNRGVGSAAPALAQVPDAGAQRLEIIDQLKGVNQRLDRLSDLLAGGSVQVKLARDSDSTRP